MQADSTSAYYKIIVSELGNQGIKIPQDKRVHLAVFTKDVLGKMKDGVKDYESRWSSKKHRPFNRISNGDFVVVKESKGPVVAVYTAEDVSFVKNDDPQDLFIKYYERTHFPLNDYIEQKGCYITFMKMDRLQFVKLFAITKRDCQTWVSFD